MVCSKVVQHTDCNHVVPTLACLFVASFGFFLVVVLPLYCWECLRIRTGRINIDV